jgi:nucleoside-triphosphatase THEP1
MKPEKPLSDIWVKASVLGTLWAASEIVLGSFLHNLRIPFSGNILAGIGIVLMIAVSYRWNEKGLFWRAGLICALMKTMSPSAVIFGPMIAIFSQGLLMEGSTRLLGRTMAGYLAGAALAMSWNFFQKIFNLWIFYGDNLVAIYTNLAEYARRQTGITSDLVWWPLLILLLLYVIFGIMAGIIGIRTGRRLLQEPGKPTEFNGQRQATSLSGHSGNGFRHSFAWLGMSLVMMAGALLLIARSPWMVWMPVAAAVVSIWALRYRRALRQLARPRLWISFLVITMLATLAFYRLSPNGLSLGGAILTGLQMNFRAAILITGFAVLGTELYHPRIREYFMQSAFRQLPRALDLAFESLPAMIAHMPHWKTFTQNPLGVLRQLAALADHRLQQLRETDAAAARIMLVSGPRNAGKTTFLKKLVQQLQAQGHVPAGILSLKVWDKGQLAGYDMYNVSSGQCVPLLRIQPGDSREMVGNYYICRQGFVLGRRTLLHAARQRHRMVFVDEVGRLELQGGGWAGAINTLTRQPGLLLVLCVRDAFVEEVIRKWNIKSPNLVSIHETSVEAAEKILSQWTCQNKSAQNSMV